MRKAATSPPRHRSPINNSPVGKPPHEQERERARLRERIDEARNTASEVDALVGAVNGVLAIPRLGRGAISSARHLSALLAAAVLTLGEQLGALASSVQS